MLTFPNALSPRREPHSRPSNIAPPVSTKVQPKIQPPFRPIYPWSMQHPKAHTKSSFSYLKAPPLFNISLTTSSSGVALARRRRQLPQLRHSLSPPPTITSTPLTFNPSTTPTPPKQPSLKQPASSHLHLRS